MSRGRARRSRPLFWLVGFQLATLAVGLWMCAELDRALAGMFPASAGDAAGRLGPLALSFGWIAVLQGLSLWMYESRSRQVQAAAEAAFDQRQTKLHADILRLRDAIVFGLAKLAESRDSDTGHHLERIAAYSTRLAEVLRRHPNFSHTVSGPFVQDIGVSSALHDIGKVAVEDSILLKPSRLTAEERERMQAHSRIGAICIEQIGRRLGDANFLQLAQQIALYHHERWDGTGYPGGLQGESIPLSARIVALADVYDALSAHRVYKSAYSHEQCIDIIRRESGKHFDPQIVSVFLEIEADFRRIHEQYTEAELGGPNQTQDSPRRREHAGALMSVEMEQQLIQVLSEPQADSAAKSV